MYEFYKNVEKEKICLSYLGSFDDNITDKLIGLSESYLENISQLSKLKNKVSFLIAECFQNVVRHGNTKELVNENLFGHKNFFQINVFDDRVTLSSCNLIKNNLVEELKSKIEQVNSLTAEDLKKLYAEVLENQQFSDKGGAGLGLIDMARKSGLPLKNEFKHLTDEYSEFILGLEIAGTKEKTPPKVSISENTNFYKQLVSENILILYKGDFSRESISSLVEMFQTNFIDANNLSSEKTKCIITLIEALQNISKHGKIINGSKEGIFTICESDNQLIIECGNFIEKESINSFKSNIDSLKAASTDEIIKLYKKKLVESEISNEGNCGLGLLEIARNSSNNYTYKFTQTPENEIFFSIKIKTT